MMEEAVKRSEDEQLRQVMEMSRKEAGEMEELDPEERRMRTEEEQLKMVMEMSRGEDPTTSSSSTSGSGSQPTMR